MERIAAEAAFALLGRHWAVRATILEGVAMAIPIVFAFVAFVAFTALGLEAAALAGADDVLGSRSQLGDDE